MIPRPILTPTPSRRTSSNANYWRRWRAQREREALRQRRRRQQDIEGLCDGIERMLPEMKNQGMSIEVSYVMVELTAVRGWVSRCRRLSLARFLQDSEYIVQHALRTVCERAGLAHMVAQAARSGTDISSIQAKLASLENETSFVQLQNLA